MLPHWPKAKRKSEAAGSATLATVAPSRETAMFECVKSSDRSGAPPPEPPPPEPRKITLNS